MLGVHLKELPTRLGFSERMLFGYRSGKYPITSKAWRKLEQAERAAGLFPVSAEVRPDWMHRKMDDQNDAEKAQELVMMAKDCRRQAAMFRKMAEDEERQAQECERSAREMLGRKAAKSKGKGKS